MNAFMSYFDQYKNHLCMFNASTRQPAIGPFKKLDRRVKNEQEHLLSICRSHNSFLEKSSWKRTYITARRWKVIGLASSDARRPEPETAFHREFSCEFSNHENWRLQLVVSLLRDEGEWPGPVLSSRFTCISWLKRIKKTYKETYKENI